MQTVNSKMIIKMFDYNIWAFERVWTCIDQLTDEQFCLDTGFSQGSIRDQMVHVISSTRRWVDRLQNLDARPHLKTESFSTKNDVKNEWAQFVEEMAQYSKSSNPESLNETIHWEISSRNSRSVNSRWEILLHVFNHTTDHRAQILAMIDLLFHKETVEQDLIFFLSES